MHISKFHAYNQQNSLLHVDITDCKKIVNERSCNERQEEEYRHKINMRIISKNTHLVKSAARLTLIEDLADDKYMYAYLIPSNHPK